MPIEVYQVENLTWDNGGYAFPNAIPTVFKDQKKFAVRPAIHNYFGGTLTLVGAHWNWCKYNGQYYFLEKERCLNTRNPDPKKQRWTYKLIRDQWTNNVLLGKVILKADVASWGVEKDILENLNKTTLTIENPVGLARVCFKEQKVTWKTPLEVWENIQEIKADFKEIYLNKRTLDGLIKKVRLIQNYKTTKPYLYSRRNDLFLFGHLKPTTISSTWKAEVKKRVNEAVTNLVRDPKAYLGKVTYAAPGGNALINNYCFTYEGDAIGNKDESIQIKKIDLSGVTDIRRVSWNDLEKTRVDIPITLNNALLDIDIRGESEEQTEKVYKLSQRNYLPIGKDVLVGRWFPSQYLSWHWNNQLPGQHLTINKSDNNEATFYYVDQINFFLSWYIGQKYKFWDIDQQYWFRKKVDEYLGTSDTQSGAWSAVDIKFNYLNPAWYARKEIDVFGYTANSGKDVSWTITEDQAFGLDTTGKNLKSKLSRISSANIYYKDHWETRAWAKAKTVKLWSPSVLPHIPFNTTTEQEKYIWNKFDEYTPSYGILIWQISKSYSEWKRIEYISETPTNTLQVINGINQNSLIDRYSLNSDNSNKEWWRRVDENHPLRRFTGQIEFARMFLDFWQLNFLHYFPTPSDEKNYEYEQSKCVYQDPLYSIDKLIVGRQCEVYKILHESKLKDLDNKPVENPWTPGKFGAYIKEVENKIDQIFLKEEIQLPRQLQKGDYLISSLEYRWDNYNYSHWFSRVTTDLSKIKPDSWEAQTFGLLEDFADLNPGTIRDVSIEQDTGWKDEDTPQIFLGLDLEGKVDFFTSWKFQKEIQLNSSPNQYITKVDGATNKNITYYHLRKWNANIDVITQGLGVLQVLEHFYKNVAKKDIRTNTAGQILWDNVPMHELDEPVGNLFDLVGSDWYAFIRKDKVHFICKNNSAPYIAPVEGNVQSFAYPEDSESNGMTFTDDGIKALRDLPLAAKANQICTLYYRGYPMTIKTKFLFDGSPNDSKPQAEIKGIPTKDQATALDYFLFKFSSSFDHIDEILKIPKEPATGKAIADQVATDRAREESRRAAEEADLSRRLLGLDQNIIDSTERRAQYDLSLTELNKRISDQFAVTNAATGTITNAISLGASGIGSLAGGIGGGVIGSAVGLGLRGFSNISGSVKANYVNSQISNAPLNAQGLPQIAGVENSWFQTQSTVQNSVFYNYEMKERAERIAENKRFSYQRSLFNSYSIDLSYRNRKRDNALLLNRLGHEWIKEPVNDTFLNKKWIEEKKLNELYMTVRYPKGEQLEQLQAHIKEYGYDVDMPNKVITLRSGMSPNIIKIRNLSEENIQGVSDILERQFLMKLLERGIKIFSMNEVENNEYDYFETSIFLPKFKNYDKLANEVEDLKHQIDDLIQGHTEQSKSTTQLARYLLKKLEDEITDIYGLEKDVEELKEKWEEIEKEADKYTDESKDLFNDVLGILEKRLETAKELDNKLRDKDRKIAVLETENEQCHKSIAQTLQQKEALEDERDKCREELNAAHNKERTLLNEKDDLQKTLNTTIEDKNRALQEVKHLRDINDGWKKFARTLSIPTRPGKKPDEPATEEDLKDLQEKLKEKISNQGSQISAYTAEIEKLKADLKEAKKGASSIGQRRQAEQVTQWTYGDFLNAFKQVNFDFVEMYKIITKAPLYGFLKVEFWNYPRIPLLQAIHQTIEECEDLLDNDVYFAATENQEIRQWLLTDEGATLLRSLKWEFVEKWARLWSARKTPTEHIKSQNFEGTVNSAYHGSSFNFSGKFLWKYFVYDQTLCGEQQEELDKQIKKWPENKKPVWEQSKEWERSSSFSYIMKYLKFRLSGRTTTNQWQDWNNYIWYSRGYYDIYGHNWSPIVMLYSVVHYLSIYNADSSFYSMVGNRVKGSVMFQYRPSNKFSHSWTYKSYSNRKFFPGYAIVMYFFLLFEYSQMNQNQRWWTSTEIAPTNLNILKEWFSFLGSDENYFQRAEEWELIATYEYICNNRTRQEAADEADKYMAEKYPKT